MKISRENFNKFEEGVLYLYGILVFLNVDQIKLATTILILVLILRKLLFKERLECGNEKLKNFLLLFIVGGTVWNFLGGMSYKSARNFIKLCRYMSIIFYIFPMIKRDKKILYKFFVSCLVGYLILFIKVLQEYITGSYRVIGFSGINTTAKIGSIMASIFFPFSFEVKKIYKKIICLLLTLVGIFFIIASKGRGPLVSFCIVASLTIFILPLLKIKKEQIIKTIVLIFIFTSIFYIKIPKENLARYNNIFKVEQTIENSSNGLRIEMWKNAIWRIKQNPIFGSGTKYDGENLFKKYVEKMPERTTEEKWYKETFLHGFNDAHNMYLNAVVDNGLFVIFLFFIWFLIPIYLVLEYSKNSEDRILIFSLLTGIISYDIQGIFWPIWRNEEQVHFWILFGILVSIHFKFLDEKK